MLPDIPTAVAEVLASFPDRPRQKLEELRALILTTAAGVDGVGPIEETLKWGEPAYLTAVSKSGSTIRLGWKAKRPEEYFMYFNCNTNLVATFRGRFGDQLVLEGERAIVFHVDEPVPADVICSCIEAALLYHRRR